METACPSRADSELGPRVHVACRAFDFTLLFEDGFFTALPAAVFLIILPWRLWQLYRRPVLITSPHLTVCKLGMLSVLFCLYVVSATLRTRFPDMYSQIGLASDVLGATSVLFGCLLSFVEDQRSPRPSDLLVVYFTATTLLSLPRLRTLWLIHVGSNLRATCVASTIVAALVVFLESAQKTRFSPLHYRFAAVEHVASFWNRSFFVWLLPFLHVGYAKHLQLQDIPKVSRDLAEESTRIRLTKAWQKVHGKHRLLRATLLANWQLLCAAVPPRLALSAFTFCQPFLIESSVAHFNATRSEDNSRLGKALVGAFLLTYLGIAVSRALYWRQTYRMTTAIRAGLISSIYTHTVTLKAVQVKDSAALTLMGTDVERIAVSLRWVHEIWASIPEVAVAIWLLARHISAASIVPLLVCLASVAAASRIARSFGSAQKAWVDCVQTRVSATASMLSDIKAVKMLGLTEVLSNIISRLRSVELQTSETFRSLLTWQILVGNTPTVLAPFATFLTYAVIAKYSNNETLFSAQAFASLSIINLTTYPIILFCEALPTCMQAVACFTRIEAYCLKQRSGPAFCSPLPSRGLTRSTEIDCASRMPTVHQELVALTGADVSWTEEASKTVLHGLTLAVHSGFTAIVGPVASGKSTLLATLLGETTLTCGTMSDALSGVAFCPQTPWIMDDTIRHNIIGYSAFDEKWYDSSVRLCCLQDDFNSFPDGDRKKAGSNGASLSGGQRQRVALARAVYSKLPVIIMDDVTSGFDAKTARSISTQLFGRDGHFRKTGISVILATQNRQILSQMDSIIVLNKSRVVDSGSREDVQLRNASLFQQIAVSNESSSTDIETEMDALACSEQKQEMSVALEPSPGISPADKSLNRRSGSWSVYGYYCQSAGNFPLIFWCLFTIIGALATYCTPLWIQKWTEDNESRSGQGFGLFLGVYGALFVISTAATAGECWVFFIRIINNTAFKLHSDLLKATLRQAGQSPFSFFQTADVGVITNRFSQDMDLIDMTLPSQAIQFTTGAASCAAQLIIICILGKYLASTIPVLLGALVLIQRVLPAFALFAGGAFCHEESEILNQSQKPYYMLLCVQQWLALVLDLVVGALAVIIVALAMFLNGAISAGGLGTSLVLVLQFNSLLTQSVQAWTKLETSIGAVARVQHFLKDTPSEPDGAAPPSDWPSRGEVEFFNLTASYSPSTPVLKNLSLKVEAGEKVAICGTSGSGKSSLVMAALLMIGLDEGYVAIDGVDTSTLEGRRVRSCISTVPQEPFFIPGTVRFNVDPHDLSDEEVIATVLEKVGLLSKIESIGGLEETMTPSEWSQGEKQLLCLARAMLVPSKVLILDEAASSVDEKTELIMQEILEFEFRDCTNIAVLHRFTYIHAASIK
ncbi:hypothetical protein HIM_08919 [Hirsutella minnesotensis 3608]|uniref:ABC transporter n=1 Tax=Hirsutella minnesotensis 3608 TaxID=1043627 RepID=A0A0F7ZGY1_9HYPO|nr:hypothetical protein HIM_08919 [Hirsutella minnesotensis 3608]